MTLDQLRARLEAYFAHRDLERSFRSLGPLVVLTGGFASDLYTFTIQQAEVGGVRATKVLKTYAPDARGRAHASREWQALTHLRIMNYAVPRASLYEPDARHIGRPFIVMDHISDSSFWHAFEAADSIAQERLVQSFVTQLRALHALDPHVLEPAATQSHPYAYIEQELEQLRRDSAHSPHAALAGVVLWLEQRKRTVPCERLAILHRDYHPWNVLVDAVHDLWVIDWDWRIGDARFDLAWTCMLMRRSGFDAFSDAVRSGYANQGDWSLGDFRYFEVLATVRWLLNVLPSVESDALRGAAQRQDFRKFLVEPVRRAREFLQEHTGIDAGVRM